ncbi:hypothetical protein GCM10012278_77750 [Nonomuraea glycinis]|uniref:Uncharacterized protein n=1 Tax=Nonomuraea glycinis TaxID=2047744 RepID=A0A918AGE9_9ACTN|nr:hypothetical protein GCM10012278_77750 [Nonomuraea glycinis]
MNDGIGPERDQVRLGTLPGAELDAHLTANPKPFRRRLAQADLQQVKSRGMEVSLWTHEDQASINQLCVRRQIRNVIEVFRHKPLRGREHPIR